ncbi:MAG: LysR substrate-binding domain-containing protein [Thioalkalivibrionaceae bacterium]
MSDRRLQVFQAVARTLSFTRAAELLHMTQPAVTFQIRALEDRYGARLFDRNHHRVVLTDAGRIVERYAERILDTHRELEAALEQFKGGGSGTLVLGASTTVAEYLLPPMLGTFRRSSPQTALRVREGNSEQVVQMVEERTVDVGVIEAPVAPRRLERRICMEDELVLVVPPDNTLARLAEVDVARLVDEGLTCMPFVCRELGSGTREVVAKWFATQSAGERLAGCIELGSSEAIKGAVANGLGLSILSRVVIGKELQLGLLRAVPLSPRLRRPITLVRHAEPWRSPALERLVRLIEQSCRVRADSLKAT